MPFYRKLTEYCAKKIFNPDFPIIEINCDTPKSTISNFIKIHKDVIIKVDEFIKRRGKNGDFITHQGMYIFANTQVVFREAKHTFLEPDAVKKTAGGIPAGVSGLNLSTGEIFN